MSGLNIVIPGAAFQAGVSYGPPAQAMPHQDGLLGAFCTRLNSSAAVKSVLGTASNGIVLGAPTFNAFDMLTPQNAGINTGIAPPASGSPLTMFAIGKLNPSGSDQGQLIGNFDGGAETTGCDSLGSSGSGLYAISQEAGGQTLETVSLTGNGPSGFPYATTFYFYASIANPVTHTISTAVVQTVAGTPTISVQSSTGGNRGSVLNTKSLLIGGGTYFGGSTYSGNTDVLCAGAWNVVRSSQDLIDLYNFWKALYATFGIAIA